MPGPVESSNRRRKQSVDGLLSQVSSRVLVAMSTSHNGLYRAPLRLLHLLWKRKSVGRVLEEELREVHWRKALPKPPRPVFSSRLHISASVLLSLVQSGFSC